MAASTEGPTAPTWNGWPATASRPSASREIWRTVHCDVVIVDPAAVPAGTEAA